jgi:hypothetical protein
MVDNLNCNFCQMKKLDGKGFGLLPECEVRSIPFEECAVDLIGPWTVQVCGKPYKFEALTVKDTVTNLVKLVRIEKKNSDHIMQKFAQCWLTHYPWPQRCIHDHVVPTEITYMDTEDEYKYMVSKIHIFKVHIFKLHILYLEIIKIHIFKSIFRFPISPSGLPNFFFSEKLRRSVG